MKNTITTDSISTDYSLTQVGHGQYVIVADCTAYSLTPLGKIDRRVASAEFKLKRVYSDVYDRYNEMRYDGATLDELQAYLYDLCDDVADARIAEWLDELNEQDED